METLKPWITKGIKQWINVRERLYKDMTMTKNILLCQIKEKSFKKYCNKIVDLIKINRKSHYQKFFEKNKINSKAIWQGIHNITYSKKGNRINTPSSLLIEGNNITEPQDISLTLRTEKYTHKYLKRNPRKNFHTLIHPYK